MRLTLVHWQDYKHILGFIQIQIQWESSDLGFYCTGERVVSFFHIIDAHTHHVFEQVGSCQVYKPGLE